MKLHKKIVEDGAGGATCAGGDIAGGPSMPLFTRLVQRTTPKVIQIQFTRKKKKKVTEGLGLREEFYSLTEYDNQSSSMPQHNDQEYDTSEVIAKLKSVENKEKVDTRDTAQFGLKDDHGNLVCVTVRRDQADNFEAALQNLLAQRDDEDEVRNAPEIAEILFKLKDHFDVVDVEWPEVEEDEEQEMGVEAQPQDGMDPNDPNAMQGMDPNDPNAMAVSDPMDDAKQLLTQVIDMMKADAEARKAEAHAKTAEAKAKEAEAAAHKAVGKVRQEEQILDMEAFDKQKKEEQKEAKRLAQLARWKHEMEKEEGASFDDGMADFDVGAMTGSQAPVSKPQAGRPGENEEMTSPPPTTAQPKTMKGRVAPADVAKFILSRVK